MAKKKVIDLRTVGDVPAGDVNITYNGVRIGGFSEDTDATLKTGMKRVEHDIGIEYTKPEAPAGARAIPFSFSGSADVQIDSPIYKVVNNNLVLIATSEINSDDLFIIPSEGDRDNYAAQLIIESGTNAYNVTLNGNTVAYNNSNHWYNCVIVSDTYPQSFNVIVTPK